MKNRIIVDLKSPSLNHIYLPNCKSKISNIIDEIDFQKGNIEICNAEIIGYGSLRFNYGASIHEYNLLAEKLDRLDDNQRELLYGVLDTRKDNQSQLVINVTPTNICSIIDNLQNFKIHENKTALGFDKLLQCAGNEVSDKVVQYIGTESSYIDNYEEYAKYEMPYDYNYMKVTISEIGNSGIRKVLTFPLNDEQQDWLDLIGERKFEVIDFESEFKPYIKFDVGKEELTKLNEFATMFFDKFEVSQNRFVALFEYYDEMISQEVEGIPFDEYFEIYDNLNEFEIWSRDGFEKMLVEKFCEFNKINPELNKFIDGKKLFDELFENEPIYVAEKDMFVYQKDFIEELLEKQKEGTLNQSEENSFEIEM